AAAAGRLAADRWPGRFPRAADPLAARSGPVALLDLDDLRELRRFGEGGRPILFNHSPDSPRGLWKNGDGTLSVRALKNGPELHRFPPHTHLGAPGALSPDGRCWVSKTEGDQNNQTIRVWDLESGKELCRLEVKDTYVRKSRSARTAAGC